MKRKALFSFALASSLLFSACYVSADEIHDLERQKEEKQAAKQQLENELDIVKTEKNAVEAKIQKLMKEIEENLTAISETETKINGTKTEIASTILRIGKAEIQLKNKQEILAENLRIMYSKGQVSYMEFLFRSESMTDFIYRFQSLEDLAKANEKLYQEIKDLLAELKEQRAHLEEKKTKLEEEKASLSKLQKELQVRQDEQLDAMQKLEAQEYHIHNEVSAQDDAINAINSEIAAVIQAREEARKKALQEKQNQQGQPQNAPSGGYGNEINATGQFALPMKSGTYYLSSPYGWRTHPVTGAKKFHNGTDFAAALGTPIYAADSGTVLFAGAANGYGNWVVIDHNNGYYTIYGHMYANGLYVKPGQVVTKGQHIAATGSAGTSTGNHLHFCVATSFNGSTFTYTDPMQFF